MMKSSRPERRPAPTLSLIPLLGALALGGCGQKGEGTVKLHGTKEEVMNRMTNPLLKQDAAPKDGPAPTRFRSIKGGRTAQPR